MDSIGSGAWIIGSHWPQIYVWRQTRSQGGVRTVVGLKMVSVSVAVSVDGNVDGLRKLTSSGSLSDSLSDSMFWSWVGSWALPLPLSAKAVSLGLVVVAWSPMMYYVRGKKVGEVGE